MLNGSPGSSTLLERPASRSSHEAHSQRMETQSMQLLQKQLTVSMREEYREERRHAKQQRVDGISAHAKQRNKRVDQARCDIRDAKMQAQRERECATVQYTTDKARTAAMQRTEYLRAVVETSRGVRGLHKARQNAAKNAMQAHGYATMGMLVEREVGDAAVVAHSRTCNLAAVRERSVQRMLEEQLHFADAVATLPPSNSHVRSSTQQLVGLDALGGHLVRQSATPNGPFGTPAARAQGMSPSHGGLPPRAQTSHSTYRKSTQKGTGRKFAPDQPSSRPVSQQQHYYSPQQHHDHNNSAGAPQSRQGRHQPSLVQRAQAQSLPPLPTLTAEEEEACVPFPEEDAEHHGEEHHSDFIARNKRAVFSKTRLPNSTARASKEFQHFVERVINDAKRRHRVYREYAGGPDKAQCRATSALVNTSLSSVSPPIAGEGGRHLGLGQLPTMESPIKKAQRHALVWMQRHRIPIQQRHVEDEDEHLRDERQRFEGEGEGGAIEQHHGQASDESNEAALRQPERQDDDDDEEEELRPISAVGMTRSGGTAATLEMEEGEFGTPPPDKRIDFGGHSSSSSSTSSGDARMRQGVTSPSGKNAPVIVEGWDEEDEEGEEREDFPEEDLLRKTAAILIQQWYRMQQQTKKKNKSKKERGSERKANGEGAQQQEAASKLQRFWRTSGAAMTDARHRRQKAAVEQKEDQLIEAQCFAAAGGASPRGGSDDEGSPRR